MTPRPTAENAGAFYASAGADAPGYVPWLLRGARSGITHVMRCEVSERRRSSGGGLPAERLALVRSDAADPPPLEPRRYRDLPVQT